MLKRSQDCFMFHPLGLFPVEGEERGFHGGVDGEVIGVRALVIELVHKYKNLM